MGLGRIYNASVQKSKYATHKREPFFEIASTYYSPDGICVDIGSGEGNFLKYLQGRQITADNLYLLDGNEETVEKNKGLTARSVYYRAPGKLPFEDKTVSFIHSSHLVDNLSSSDLYQFLSEIDRTLRPGGVLVISTPLLWNKFYDDLSHTRPFNEVVFTKYLIQQYEHAGRSSISNNYKVEKLAYRYYKASDEEGLGSDVPVIDFLISIGKKIRNKLGIGRFYKNGYTLVLRKV